MILLQDSLCTSLLYKTTYYSSPLIGIIRKLGQQA